MSTEVKGKELIVSKIRDGIVIDHIPVGRALMELLNHCVILNHVYGGCWGY